MNPHPYHHVGGEDGEQSLTVFLPGSTPVTVTGDHPHFAEILEAAQDGADPTEIDGLADLSVAVGGKLSPLSERVSVYAGRVYFDGDAVESALTRQIVRCLDDGLSDWRPLVRFMENAAENPETHSRAMLFDWLSDRDFTITEDGCFIGYKGVVSSGGGYVSLHSGPAIVDGQPVNGQVPNNPGSTVEIARSEVQFDPGVGCSTGLHVGTYEYAQSYARGAMLKVKVNPRDVVSVPTDCNAEKLRTCRYVILETIDGEVSEAVVFDQASEPASATAFATV
jgi:hypothetical protein